MTAITFSEDYHRLQRKVIAEALREAREEGERQLIVDRVYEVPQLAAEARREAILRRAR